MALSIKKQRWHIRRWFLKLSKLQRSVLIALPVVFVALMVGTTFALASKTKANNQSDVLPIEITNTPQAQPQTQQSDHQDQAQSPKQQQNNQNKPANQTMQSSQAGNAAVDFSISLSQTQVSFSRATTSPVINATATNQVLADWTISEPTGSVVVDSVSATQQSPAATFTLRANNAGNFTVLIRASAGGKTIESTLNVTVTEENFNFEIPTASAQDGNLSLQIVISSTPGITSFSGSGIDLNKCGLSVGTGIFNGTTGSINFTYDVNQPPQNCIIEVTVNGGGLTRTAEYTFIF